MFAMKNSIRNLFYFYALVCVFIFFRFSHAWANEYPIEQQIYSELSSFGHLEQNTLFMRYRLKLNTNTVFYPLATVSFERGHPSQKKLSLSLWPGYEKSSFSLGVTSKQWSFGSSSFFVQNLFEYVLQKNEGITQSFFQTSLALISGFYRDFFFKEQASFFIDGYQETFLFACLSRVCKQNLNAVKFYGSSKLGVRKHSFFVPSLRLDGFIDPIVRLGSNDFISQDLIELRLGSRLVYFAQSLEKGQISSQIQVFFATKQNISDVFEKKREPFFPGFLMTLSGDL